MPQHLALFICVLFILWLFVRDQKLRPMTSGALWIVLAWIIIIGSRPISFWFGAETDVESIDVFMEGSPLDRSILLVLIIAGAVVLLRRRPDWHKIFESNRWFFAFFIYCGISIIWSDYPFISFKRWTKELGNVIIVLIILTEEDPVHAVRAVFARYAYFAVPLSVVLINYFPDIGIYYAPDLSEAAYGGVTVQKNTLGIIAFICGLFLVWDLIYMRSPDDGRTDRADLFGRGALLLMAAWLIYMAHSSTADVCMILGTGILLFVKLPFVRRQVKYLGTYSLAVGFLIILLYTVPGILDSFVKILGRDNTLTGRTDLWADVLGEPINRLLGTGYQDFWLGARADYFWDKYAFHPIQAHNGYLETYLNGGLLGLFLLLAMLIYTGSKLKRELLLENSFGILLFAVFVSAVFYNWTEAMFSRLHLFWFLLIITALYRRPSYESVPEEMAPAVQGDP